MSFWSRQSIAVKLPLMGALLLLIALGAMGVAGYYEMRRTVLAIASERLDHASSQIAGVFNTSVRQRTTQMQPLIQRPEIKSFLAAPDTDAEPVRQLLTKYLGTASNAATVELVDTNGRRVLTAGLEAPEFPADKVKEMMALYNSVPGPAYGHMWAADTALANPVGSAVRDGAGVIGYVFERRRGANAAQTAALLSGLIGDGASILLGNDDGSAWSDLSEVVEGPPIPVSETGGLLSYSRAGRPPVFARAKAIAGAPWVVVIELPRALVLAPTRRLLVNSGIIAALLIVIAAVAAWALSRRITKPLRQVTDAAVAVANSQPAVKVPFKREDELGRLAESFNTMAEKVEEGRVELEHRVDLRTAELRAANRELEAFSYSVSHDLRAPVRAIAGFVQILEEDHGDKMDAGARRSLERVKVNARRMGQLIDDLLAFSQIGRTPLSRKWVDMTALATGVVDDAKRASGMRLIDFTVETLPPTFGEPALINQVLVNLVANAVKFTATREHATITIGAIADGDGHSAYFVRDNGVGFDMRHAEKLFGVFQRLHKTEDFEGTGVGLAIIDRVVTRHGGRVWAEGEVDKGATFYFTLPTAP
jgi:signal transduction histidine kinase